MSLAASADGRRLVATVSRSTAAPWRVPIAESVIAGFAATPIVLPTARGLSPRRASLSSSSCPESGNGCPPEARGRHVKRAVERTRWAPLGTPAIAPDGQRLASLVQRRGLTQLYCSTSIGAACGGSRKARRARSARVVARRAMVGHRSQSGSRRVSSRSLSVAGRRFARRESSTDPTWSPSGKFLVYSGDNVGTTFSVKAVGADGMPLDLGKLAPHAGCQATRL